MSERSIRGAAEWLEEIDAALKRCDWFVIVLTPEAVASKWVKREVSYAISEDRYDKHVIPVFRKFCDPAEIIFVLKGLQRIDFRKSFAIGMRDLLRIWGMGYVPR